MVVGSGFGSPVVVSVVSGGVVLPPLPLVVVSLHPTTSIKIATTVDIAVRIPVTPDYRMRSLAAPDNCSSGQPFVHSPLLLSFLLVTEWYL
ncbi:hypothetical protein GCM10029976_027900 [Kribbella albertanoniae]